MTTVLPPLLLLAKAVCMQLQLLTLGVSKNVVEISFAVPPTASYRRECQVTAVKARLRVDVK